MVQSQAKLQQQMLKFHWFDFHHETKQAGKWKNLSKLISEVDSDFRKQGFFCKLGNGNVLSQQCGVIRTNCMDNLDRTNVVQSLFARRSLLIQLGKQLGTHPKPTLRLQHYSPKTISSFCFKMEMFLRLNINLLKKFIKMYGQIMPMQYHNYTLVQEHLRLILRELVRERGTGYSMMGSILACGITLTTSPTALSKIQLISCWEFIDQILVRHLPLGFESDRNRYLLI